jgi:hypothetical protein
VIIEMRNKNKVTTVIWIAVVLASAAGLGYGIRKIRWSLEIRKNLSESKALARTIGSEPEAETVPKPEPEVGAVEIDTTTIEEPVLEESEDELQSQPSQKARNSGPTSQGLGDWRSVWADLNLTQEEHARVREGWRIAVERWQNMSEQERQFRIERMRASREKWENMSDIEKEQASWELRRRIEKWRQSGSTELPDLILD